MANINEIKVLLKSLVISCPNNLTVEKLADDYAQMEGSEIPYRKFGFRTLEDFLYAIPDAIQITGFGRNAFVRASCSDKVKHINKMVCNQKNASHSRKIAITEINENNPTSSVAPWNVPYLAANDRNNNSRYILENQCEFSKNFTFSSSGNFSQNTKDSYSTYSYDSLRCDDLERDNPPPWLMNKYNMQHQSRSSHDLTTSSSGNFPWNTVTNSQTTQYYSTPLNDNFRCNGVEKYDSPPPWFQQYSYTRPSAWRDSRKINRRSNQQSLNYLEPWWQNNRERVAPYQRSARCRRRNYRGEFEDELGDLKTMIKSAQKY